MTDGLACCDAAMSAWGQTENSRHPALMSAPTQIPDFVAPGHLSRPSAKWHFLTVQAVCARRASCGSHKGWKARSFGAEAANRQRDFLLIIRLPPIVLAAMHQLGNGEKTRIGFIS